MSENNNKPKFITVILVTLVAVLVTTIFVVIISKLLGGNLSLTTIGFPILAVIIGVIYFFLVLKDKMGL
jgi:hypothetical protein